MEYMRTEYDGLHSRIETSETRINKDLCDKSEEQARESDTMDSTQNSREIESCTDDNKTHILVNKSILNDVLMDSSNFELNCFSDCFHHQILNQQFFVPEVVNVSVMD
jgi:hypothetical protein